MTATEILKEAQNDMAQIIADRRYLHQHAETGFYLTETLSYVHRALTDMGYEPEYCGKAGIVALCGGKTPGKVFLIRADMDALPISEEATFDFASKNGKMHACGHDMHTTMLLEAARLLKAHEEEIPGTVKLMFQPAEELLEGAKDMIDAGVLENPKVDAALMIHVMTNVPFKTGTAIISDGGVSAPAADYFTIDIQGRGCHGSMPETGVDPINTAAHIITALQEIHARELSIHENAVLTIGTLSAGQAVNVIPDTVSMGGTLRAYDDAVRIFIKKRMNEIVKNTATAFRAVANVEFGSGCPTLLNDEDLSVCTLKYIKELNAPDMVYTAKQLLEMSGTEKAPNSSGSEDFAYVSHKVPSIMLALAAGQPENSHSYPLHHPKVTFDEAVLPIGGAIYAYTAIRWLSEHK